ncbi:uncharacterized protein LOC131039784 [Cryptomeria japonica]|uniref:uncharacterized protein LOC131039784 n=1 Tax=Cryptomeria japonica TaxID=3369 RepID=UPI0027D9EC97|nr:uncharacterized protein LOC131039784 [Cryptomeria japonica]
MSELLKKRSREEEVLQNSPKRFQGRNEQQYLQTSENIQFVEKIKGEEQLAITSFVEEETGVFLFSGDDMTSRCENKESENGIDLSYLLEASDDELGLPASPVANIDNQNVCAAASSDKQGFGTCSDSAENAEQKDFLENWHFEDDFVDYAQFAVFDDAAASAWDVVNLEAFIDGDYSTSWELETIC